MDTEVLEIDIHNTIDALMALRPSSCTLNRIVELECPDLNHSPQLSHPPPSPNINGISTDGLLCENL